jgi:hypothetical protein
MLHEAESSKILSSACPVRAVLHGAICESVSTIE